jgi:hypothetical protein
MKRYRRQRKSKSEVKKWLATNDGQKWLHETICKNKEAKAEYRNRIDTAAMESAGVIVDCNKCLHKIGGHCDLNLPRGCFDYLEVGTLKRVSG